MIVFFSYLKEGARGITAAIGAGAANMGLGYLILSQSRETYAMIFVAVCVGHAGLLVGALLGGG